MQDPLRKDADAIDKLRCNSRTWVSKARGLCKEPSRIGPIWSAYGGYYFSPRQALIFDYMLSLLPKKSGDRNACLAATIVAASECAASPGHTAQPFRPTTTAAPFIREAWVRNPAIHAEKALRDICGRFATVAGHTKVGDAIDLVNELSEKDLVFVDPPYSGVHYSRFYHVLETVARGHCGEVAGAGRYPPSEERPASGFSRKSEAKAALNLLLGRLASRGCTVILTFPENDCSNGLSGSYITSAAGQNFRVKTRTFTGQFSTLGG